MIDNARLSASARNEQSLKYIISNMPEMNARIFPCLSWAGYLENWPGPQPGERPSAYIVVLHDTRLSKDYLCDDGIAMQSILLTATEKGFGGCIIGSVKKEELGRILNLPEHFRLLYVVALGKTSEKVIIEDMENNNFRYWRDEKQFHHVPKRSLKDIVAGEYCK